MQLIFRKASICEWFNFDIDICVVSSRILRISVLVIDIAITSM